MTETRFFFTSEQPKKYHACSCQNALTFLLDNIFRQVVVILMGTYCATLVADYSCFVMRRTL